jgi:hypothetical protein
VPETSHQTSWLARPPCPMQAKCRWGGREWRARTAPIVGPMHGNF